MSEQSTLGEFGVANTDAGTTEAVSPDGKPYKDENWLREQYWENELSLSEIADSLDVSHHTVLRWMKKHDIERRSQSEAQSDGNPSPLKNKDWLQEQYWGNEMTTEEIAELLSVSSSIVIDWMNKHGLERRSLSEASSEGDIGQLKKEDWLREQYWENELSTTEIAESLNVSRTTVLNQMEDQGIERRSLSEANSLKQYEPTDGRPYQDEDWLREQYWENELSQKEIAESVGVRPETISYWMDDHGIERRFKLDGRLDDAEWLHKQYVELQKTSYDIADECNCSRTSVLRRLKKHDIDIRHGSKKHTHIDFSKLRDPEWLREQHYNNGLTTHEIADEVGCSQMTVRRWFLKNNLESRSKGTHPSDDRLTDAEWLTEQYHDLDKSVYKIADECGCSPSTVIFWRQRHGIETKSSVRRPENLSHLVRSEWELEVANLLHDINADYTYESMTIEYDGGRTYEPDFVTEDYVIEVKGMIYDDAKSKAEAAMEQLVDREYVVLGTELPCDIHIAWENRATLQTLFE